MTRKVTISRKLEENFGAQSVEVFGDRSATPRGRRDGVCRAAAINDQDLQVAGDAFLCGNHHEGFVRARTLPNEL